MTGDGLSDIVRVRFSGVAYWPNLGYGKFGPQVTMAMPGGPMEHMELFRADRVRVADIDGSGTHDLVYFASAGTFVRLNASGNSFRPPQQLRQCPPVTSISHAELSDLNGSGTADLVWSSSGPRDRERKLRYIELMPGGKPYLLTSVRNNMGAETRVRYAPSTKFYLEDKAAGRPWVTRLAFPVQVIERTEVFNHVTGHRFASTFRYRHGYFDGAEREYRGFGYVEQRDTESFEHFGEDRLFPSGHRVENAALYVPPVVTKTWFHTGAFLGRDAISTAYAAEYWRGDPQAIALADTMVPEELHPAEVREAVRALKGATLRSEVYAEDGTALASEPYAVTERNMNLRVVQPKGERRHAVVTAFAREELSYHYERDRDDPRVSHALTLEVDGFGTVTRSAAVAYPRRTTPVVDVAGEQGQTSVVVSEVDVQHQAFGVDRHLLGVPIEQRSYELRNATVPAGRELFELEALRGVIAGATAVSFEAGPTAAVDLRLLSQARSYYYDDALAAALPLGQAGRLALPFGQRTAAFSPALLTAEMHASFDSSVLATEGGYVLEDGLWWTTTGRQVFDPAQFYAPTQAFDVFGNPPATVEYAYSSFATRAVDPLGNVSVVELDYRTLSPWRMTDPNGNVAEVAFDVMGSVSAAAVVGKPELNEGDTLADPSSRSSYDLWSFFRGEGPNWARSEAREVHQDPSTRWQVSVAYSDGGGNVVQAKVQAEAGLAPQRDAAGELVLDDTGELVLVPTNSRWIGNGRTIVDNKGNPIKQYEPFFSDREDYESEAVMAEQGVTALIHYDAMGRAMRTDMPDGTLSRVEFTPWVSRSFDANDTVLESDWHARAMASGDTRQTRAANLAAAHADTPSVVHLDHRGRPVLTDAHNIDAMGAAEHRQTRVTLDIVGNTLEVTDALGRSAESRVYGMLGQTLRTDSVDAGTRWGMSDVTGGPHWGRNSRDVVSSFRFDAARRPTHAFVTDGGGVTRLRGRTVYGESLANPEAANLRGQAYRVYDSAGVATSVAYDFKGGLLQGQRQLATEYVDVVDWSVLAELDTVADIAAAAANSLESEVFSTSAAYDALGRPTEQVGPDSTALSLTYNDGALLERVDARLRGGANVTNFVENIDYDVRGRRASIRYGNGTTTNYVYDPANLRLTQLQTVRGDASLVQALGYIHDPVGNIVEVTDTVAATTFFAGAAVTSGQEFVYNAVYELIDATGREHNSVSQPTSEHFGVRAHPADATAMRRYREEYVYDAVGNILQMQHIAAGGDWTRRYNYTPQAGTQLGNRLVANSAPGDAAGQFSHAYNYDAHGNMTAMPHLPSVEWDFGDRLQHADLGGGGDAYYVYDGGGQRVRKVVVNQAGTQEQDRVYLGGYEVYRERSQGVVQLERETLHVSDDSGRIALVETQTVNGGAAVASPTSLWRYQYSNHIGSAALELDGSGAVVSYEEYHPYGTSSYRAADASLTASAKRYRYTGKERDEETGLYYHGARYYACWLGRWTASDPIGLGDGVNRFAYVRGSPISLSDPSGTDAEDRTVSVPASRGEQLESRARSLRNDTSDVASARAENKAALTAALGPQGYANIGGYDKDVVARLQQTSQYISEAERDLARRGTELDKDRKELAADQAVADRFRVTGDVVDYAGLGAAILLGLAAAPAVAVVAAEEAELIGVGVSMAPPTVQAAVTAAGRTAVAVLEADALANGVPVELAVVGGGRWAAPKPTRAPAAARIQKGAATALRRNVKTRASGTYTKPRTAAGEGVPNAAAKDISRITKSLDETGGLPSDFTRRGRQPGTTPGGRPWQNRDGQIQGAQGRLREADVGDVKVGPDGGRGAERFLYDEAGNTWYTPDHYETFIPIRTGRRLP